jgi:hypothetical protein
MYAEAIRHYETSWGMGLVEAFFGLVHTRKYVCDWTDWDRSLAHMKTVLATQIRQGLCGCRWWQLERRLMCTTAGTQVSLQPLHAMSFPFSHRFLSVLSVKARHISVHFASSSG